MVWLMALLLERPGPGRDNGVVFDQVGARQHGAADYHCDTGKVFARMVEYVAQLDTWFGRE